MVIKSSEEEVEKESKADKKEEDGDKDKDAGEEEIQAKDKKVKMRFIRAYFPKWRKKVTKKRLFWETSIEVKNSTSSATKQPDNLLLEEDEDG